jgi:hypothetical protein
MLRCSVVGKWTGGAVGAETGKLIGDYKVFGGAASTVQPKRHPLALARLARIAAMHALAAPAKVVKAKFCAELRISGPPEFLLTIRARQISFIPQSVAVSPNRGRPRARLPIKLLDVSEDAGWLVWGPGRPSPAFARLSATALVPAGLTTDRLFR